MHVTILTAGTRADTAPYAALALGLCSAGWRVRLVGTRAFAATARAHALDYFALDVDAFAGTASLERCQAEAWQASQGTGAILYDPLTLFNGYFLARQMGVPAVAAALSPFTPTAAHPAWPFYAGPRLGAAYNRLTHTVSRRATWQTVRGPVQKFWRQRAGYAPDLPHSQQQAEAFPVLYGYSQHVLPRPADWASHLHVSGYWPLDAPGDWRPPQALLDFLRDGPPPVYVDVPGPATALALEALGLAGLRGVLAADTPAMALPASVIRVDNVPESWLFPRMAALVHTGGAGTTAAGLRAGVPAIVLPPSGSASAWGCLLHERGLGPPPLPRAAPTAPRLAAQLTSVLGDAALRTRLMVASEAIGEEDGVAQAVEVFGEAVR